MAVVKRRAALSRSYSSFTKRLKDRFRKCRSENDSRPEIGSHTTFEYILKEPVGQRRMMVSSKTALEGFCCLQMRALPGVPTSKSIGNYLKIHGEATPTNAAQQHHGVFKRTPLLCFLHDCQHLPACHQRRLLCHHSHKRAAANRGHGGFHLHGLEHAQLLSCCDLITLTTRHLPHACRERRRDLFILLPVICSQVEHCFICNQHQRSPRLTTSQNTCLHQTLKISQSLPETTHEYTNQVGGAKGARTFRSRARTTPRRVSRRLQAGEDLCIPGHGDGCGGSLTLAVLGHLVRNACTACICFVMECESNRLLGAYAANDTVPGRGGGSALAQWAACAPKSNSSSDTCSGNFPLAKSLLATFSSSSVTS